MYRNEFLALTAPLCESEQIYKQMYELREDPAARRKYLNSIPGETIERLALFVPEYTPGWHELMPEVDFLFPFDTDVVLLKHHCYTPEFTHKHTYFEILYVYRGSCVNTVGETVLSMQTGDLCFVTPGQTHSLAVFDESIVINILVKTSTFQKNFFKILEGGDILSAYIYRCLTGTEENRFLLVHTGEDAFIRSQTELLYLESFRPQRYSAQILSNGFTMVFYYVLRNHIENMEMEYRQQNDRQIVAILNYIQVNYMDLSLETTAEEFHYNPSYLSRLLKNTTGKSFVQLVRDCRMEQACRLLRNTDHPIQEIAATAGYDSIEHFNRTFRKLYDMTPGKYRKISTSK